MLCLRGALVEACRQIGEADGHYIVEEQSALVKICRHLGIEGGRIRRRTKDLRRASTMIAALDMTIGLGAQPREALGAMINASRLHGYFLQRGNWHFHVNIEMAEKADAPVGLIGKIAGSAGVHPAMFQSGCRSS